MTMITSKFFDMGKIVVSHSINEYMNADRRFAMEINLCLRRFAVKDWGCISDDDKQSNDDALQYPDDLYLLAAYETSKGRVWIITNRISEKAGDNATIVCFPDER